MIHRLLLLAALPLVALPAQRPATLEPVPLLTFGGLSDDPNAEMLQVRRVLRVADGRFVVVTGKPFEARVFSARGRFERRLGGPGEGPGEYRGRIDIRPWSGDSVLMLSEGTRRWMLFSLQGRLIREWPVDSAHPIAAGMTLTDGHYTRQVLFGSRGCPASILARLPAPRALRFVEALTDGAGRTWRRDVVDAELWHVHAASTGRPTSVRLPAGMRIHQFSGDHVIGVAADEMDVDHVMVFHIPMGAAQQPPVTTCPPPVPPSDPGLRRLSIDARNAVVAGQALQSDFGEFAADLNGLQGLVVVSDQNRMTVLAHGPERWIFAISHLATGAVCVASVGVTGLPGWESGEVACSTTGGERR